MTRATRDSVRLPATSAQAARTRPSSTTSRKRRVSVPAWGSRAEWYFSAPAAEARHWKKPTESAPRATCDRLSRSICPCGLTGLTGCQLTAEVECSISTHGSPPASPRVTSADSARSTSGWGRCAPR